MKKTGKKVREALIAENERRYGAELREKYGADVVEASNEKFRTMPDSTYDRATALGEEINKRLRQAVPAGDPAGEAAQALCALHAQWLRMYWPDGLYSKEAHRALGESYIADARFAAYYDAVTPGGARFLRDALEIYCRKEESNTP